jgi:hypothetical protein
VGTLCIREEQVSNPCRDTDCPEVFPAITSSFSPSPNSFRHTYSQLLTTSLNNRTYTSSHPTKQVIILLQCYAVMNTDVMVLEHGILLVRTPGFTQKARKNKAIPVVGCGSLGNETSRLPHCLCNRLTYGGQVVTLTRRPPFDPMTIPGTNFC